MKIVFIGTVAFSREALQCLVAMQADVVGVITKEVSVFHSDFVDLSDVAQAHQIPVCYAKDINAPAVLSWVKDLAPDVMFCWGWSQILGKDMLQAAPRGVVGYHPALLPQNRGRHPLIWALALGLTQTGSTFFWMDEGVDTGDIISQQVIDIAYEDDAQTLYDKVIATALSQVKEFVPQMIAGEDQRISQDPSVGNAWRKRGKDDGRIDFRMSSRAIYNVTRALRRPYPGAHVMHQGNDVKVWRVQEVPSDEVNREPGYVLEAGPDGVLVKCGDGAVLLEEHDFAALPAKGAYVL